MSLITLWLKFLLIEYITFLVSNKTVFQLICVQDLKILVMLPDPSLKDWLVSAYLSKLNNIPVVIWKLVILHLSTNSLFQCWVSNAVSYTCQSSTLSTELHCQVSFLCFYQWNLFSLIFLHMMLVHVHFLCACHREHVNVRRQSQVFVGPCLLPYFR